MKKANFIALGYSDKQASKLITLSETFQNLILTHTQELLSRNYNGNTIKHDHIVNISLAALTSFQALLNLSPKGDDWKKISELGVTIEQVLSVLSHAGGSKSLDTLKTLATSDAAWESISKRGFNVTQIVKILSYDGGSINFKALQELAESDTEWTNISTKFGFTTEQIISILSCNGGSKNLGALQALLKNESTWKKILSFGITKMDIFIALSHAGGSRNLSALIALVTDNVFVQRIKDDLDIEDMNAFFKQVITFLNATGRGVKLLYFRALIKHDDARRFLKSVARKPLTVSRLVNNLLMSLQRVSQKILKKKDFDQYKESIRAAVKKGTKRKRHVKEPDHFDMTATATKEAVAAPMSATSIIDRRSTKRPCQSDTPSSVSPKTALLTETGGDEDGDVSLTEETSRQPHRPTLPLLLASDTAYRLLSVSESESDDSDMKSVSSIDSMNSEASAEIAKYAENIARSQGRGTLPFCTLLPKAGNPRSALVAKAE